MTYIRLSTSMLQRILRLNGRPDSSSKPSQKTGAPRYLLRDRDQIYGEEFRLRVQGMQIEEVITAPRSPFQNPSAERVIGSIRRECLDHLIIIGEDQLRRILRDYFDYYHNSRPHQSLERNSPTPREIEAPVKGKVIAIPQVVGLHHRYRRAA